jgi:hypothetical protein
VRAALGLGHDLIDHPQGKLLGGRQAHRHRGMLRDSGERHRIDAAPSGLMTE